MGSRDIARNIKLKQWGDIIRECQDSGMKIKDWCSENNVSKDKYYYWRSQLRDVCVESLPMVQNTATLVQIPMETMIPAPVDKPTGGLNISIGSIDIRVDTDSSLDLLKSVLQKLILELNLMAWIIQPIQ